MGTAGNKIKEYRESRAANGEPATFEIFYEKNDCRIRKLVKADVRRFTELYADQDSIRLGIRYVMGKPISALIAEDKTFNESGGYIALEIRHKGSFILIGFMRAAITRHHNSAFLTCGILGKHRSKGYLTKIYPVVLEFLREKQKIHRVEIHVFPYNLASIRAQLHEGFSFEGMRREAHFVNGSYVSSLQFSKILTLEKEEAGAVSKSYINLDAKTTCSEKIRLSKQKNALWDIEKKNLAPYLSEYTHPIVWDIGCGPGLYSAFFQEAYGNNHLYYGIDNNKAFLAQARKNFSAKHRVFCDKNIFSDSFDMQKPDIIFIRLVLMHLTSENISILLAKFRKCLNKNGRIIILDTDDGYFHLSPEPQLFDYLKHVKQLSQKKLGGDRCAGRKIYGQLKKLGYKNIAVLPHLFTSQDMGKEQFAGFIFPIFRLQMDQSLISDELAAYGLDKLKAWAADDNSFGTAVEYFYVASK